MARAQKWLFENLNLILGLTYDRNVALMQVSNKIPSAWALNAKKLKSNRQHFVNSSKNNACDSGSVT